MKKQIVNIINFVRGCEPRMDMDLLTPVREQVRLLTEHGLTGTFLLQYDALINDDFIKILDGAGNMAELGVWLEVVRPQCVAAGVTWRGREGFPWDWHANAGFTVAYSLSDREKLVDALFEKFKEIYGKYPRVFGSWAIDAYTYGYIEKKYGADAACTCRDQWGTDGYTFWGGYYNQGYYPCKNNMLCPAQSREEQINIPVFRMLGSDPIYQYDMGLDINGAAAEWQGVATLEPVYCGNDGGGNREWVDWYLSENFSGRCINFGYTQCGQENSFGWPAMCGGLTYQIDKISGLCRQGKLEVMTLGQTGRWFKESFDMTPPTVVSALTDRHGKNRSSVWYDCKNYRANVFAELDNFWIRDVFLFRQAYMERYRAQVNNGTSMTFDNLPFVDGNRFSGHGVRAGLYPYLNGERLTYSGLTYDEDEEKGSARVVFRNTEAGDFIISMDENGITFSADADFVLVNESKKGENEPAKTVSGKTLFMTHEGFEYKISVAIGKLQNADTFCSERGRLRIETVEK